MAVAFVSAILANNANLSASSVVTAPFATSGTNRSIGIIAGVSNGTGRSISSITRGSDTYASIGSVTTQMQMFTQGSTNEPQTTSAALTVTFTNAFKNTCVAVFVASDVDQTTRINGYVVNTDTTSTGGVAALAVATTTGDLVCDGICARNDWSTAAVVGSQTDRGYTSAGGTEGSDYCDLNISTLPGSGSSVNMDWTPPSESNLLFRHVAFNFVQAASNTAPTITAQASKRMVYGVANTIPFTVADTEDDAVTVVVGCTSGTLTAALASGAGVTVVSGSGTSTLTLSGSVAQFTAMGSVEYTQSGYTSDTITWDVDDGDLSGTQDTTTITMHTAKFYGGDLANLNVVLETLGLTADTTGAFTLQMVSVDGSGNTDTDTTTITAQSSSLPSFVSLGLLRRRRRGRRTGS